ncbi:MAG: hypothetical protein KJ634_08205 [Gammaproteobacteria bacterium]|nr:hypothetical protein [Gammaproteobacteria bacterium]MBU1415587.1 hypothetical protein [Gammaproteobacteria bacterium]
MNRLLQYATLSFAVGLVAGCVTINIYFPASAAEKAADSIIDEVWQLAPPATPPQAPKEKTP